MISNQKDVLIDNDKLANDVLETYEKLGILYDKRDNELEQETEAQQELSKKTLFSRKDFC